MPVSPFDPSQIPLFQGIHGTFAPATQAGQDRQVRHPRPAGERLGAFLSMPTESDCRFLESPPVVPPLKIFQVTYRPGRPKKNAGGGENKEGESGPTIPWAIKGQQRYYFFRASSVTRVPNSTPSPKPTAAAV